MAKLRNEPLRDFCALKSGSPVRGGLRASGFVGFDLDSVLFFVYAFFGALFWGAFVCVFAVFWFDEDRVCQVFLALFGWTVFGLFFLESLILAQDERWRRA